VAVADLMMEKRQSEDQAVEQAVALVEEMVQQEHLGKVMLVVLDYSRAVVVAVVQLVLVLRVPPQQVVLVQLGMEQPMLVVVAVVYTLQDLLYQQVVLAVEELGRTEKPLMVLLIQVAVAVERTHQSLVVVMQRMVVLVLLSLNTDTNRRKYGTFCTNRK
tara:strand:+ start:426 stop:905 length:480 start_codon:yes stop_codon:yes gene_type:complete